MRQPTVLVTGSHGLVGTALVRALRAEGKRVRTLVRQAPTHPDERQWDPRQPLPPAAVADCDVVFHLAGRSIQARWTPQFKATMLAERAAGVRTLHAALAAVPTPPAVLVVASAVGFYGDTQQLPDGADETTKGADDWLASVSRALESTPAVPGMRTVHARLGVVLSPAGGALKQMLPAFYCGLGGPLGTGQQRMSWIGRDDAVRALLFLAASELSGAVNVVAPAPLRQAELARTLGQVLHRPTGLPMPAWVVRLLFGEMGTTLLLRDCAVRPTRLAAAGFAWQTPDLRAALLHEFAGLKQK